MAILGSDLERALSLPDSPLRVNRLRRLVLDPSNAGHPAADRGTVARLVDALHRSGALDDAILDALFTEDRYLGYAFFGRDQPELGQYQPPVAGLACTEAVRDHLERRIWELTTPGPHRTRPVPGVLIPRGLRFVQRALDIWGRAGRDRPGNIGTRDLVEQLGRAVLTPPERVELAAWLTGRPLDARRVALALRLTAGDAESLLPALGVPDTVAVLRLLTDGPRRSPDPEVGAWDVTDIDAALDHCDPAQARDLFGHLRAVPTGYVRPATDDRLEVIEARLGWNVAAVRKRVKHNALNGIRALGLLPLDGGETALDRYVTLRVIGRRGPKLGPNRRFSHADAVRAALTHLAQISGYPDAGRLEWDMESRLADRSRADSGPVEIGDYRAHLDLNTDRIVVSRNGRHLRSVPNAVRADPAYHRLRETQETLRDQARRMRANLVEPLVSTGRPVEPDELRRLLTLPAGRAMLPGLIWRDIASGHLGLLDPDTLALVDLAGAARPVTGPVNAAHPWHLFHAGVLAVWQRELVARRVRQPVKQAFRELYLLTPAELTSHDHSRRFADREVDGSIAGALLSGRGWARLGPEDAYQACRPAGDLTACLDASFHGYWAMDSVLLGSAYFLAGTDRVPLSEVPPVPFSEVMRDLDLAVSVGYVDGGWWSDAGAESRAALLGALVADLGLPGVTVDGRVARIEGTRATYRVHLGSGSIHLEPGGHLCVVPAGFAGRPHDRLFLPFADDDRATSVVLSKVLLLADDKKITDRSILDQIDRMS
ncbi:DUF4132 domain-containing protein [Plantactinospora sp. GCM10030261]|uniref:DUF7737 domain-containing protein n=1 Tax=Plantactinospora sp. GCM10030261 TaxID=3273420 RepID=UPI0036069D7C